MAVDYPWLKSGSSDGPSETLAAALAYARLGLKTFAVHGIRNGSCSCGNPDCPSPGKHPATVHGFHDATTEESALRAQWAGRPWLNVACSTDGYVVPDVDPRNGGEASIDQLLAQYGPLPDGPLCLTGGGGKHLWMRAPAGVPVAKGRLLPGIDLQATGAYVVMPPSRHVSGGRYEWEASADLLDGYPIPNAPEWLVKLCRVTTGELRSRPDRPTRTLFAAPAHELDDVRAALGRLSADCPHEDWIRIGMALHATGWAEAFDLWDGWSATASHRYPGRRELLKRWRSLDSERDGAVTVDTLFWLARGEGPVQPLNRQAESTAEQGSVNFLTLGDLLDTPPERPWVFSEWVPGRMACLLHAQGGVGKTRLLVQLHVALALGRDLFGVAPTGAGASVLVSAEEDAESLRRIFWEVSEGFGLTATDRELVRRQVQVVDLTTAPTPVLYAEHGWTAAGRRLVEQACALGPRLLSVDNNSACFAGPATESAHVYAWVNGWVAAVKPVDGAVLLLGHENKASAVNDSRAHAYGGITAWHNACRTRLELTFDGDDTATRILRRPKGNYAAPMQEGDELRLMWANGALVQRVHGGLLERAALQADARQVVEVVRDLLELGAEMSPRQQARNNPLALAALHGIRIKLPRRRFWAGLREAIGAGMVVVSTQNGANRHARQVLGVPDWHVSAEGGDVSA